MSLYTIKMPFFLVNGTVPKSVTVKFDGVVINDNFAVTNTKDQGRQTLEFTVDKDPNTYQLEVSINPWTWEGDQADAIATTVCIDDIWLSNDGTIWKSMLIHQIEENRYLTSVNPVDQPRWYGFTWDRPARHWFDVTHIFNVPLVDATIWNKEYRHNSWAALKTWIEAQILNPAVSQQYKDTWTNMMPAAEQKIIENP